MLQPAQARLEIESRHPGILPHAITRDGILASRRYDLMERRDGGGWYRVGRVLEPTWRRLCVRSKLVTLGLRLGIHAAVRLPSGALLVVVNGRLLRFDNDQFRTVLAFDDFRKPARDGLLLDRQGRIFLAQYARNSDRRLPIRLWRSDDGGRRFDVVYHFEPGAVRHIHFVQEDPLDGSLWMGTGDRDEESGLFRSTDGGETWEPIGRGGQEWRAISLAFRPEAVYWGTDAGNDAGHYANRIFRLDRADGRLAELCRVQGPVHGITTTGKGAILLATGLERGANEADRRVHVWFSANGESWQEIASFEGGRQPRRIQYAVAHFVPGQQIAETLLLVLRGVAGMPLGFVEARVCT